MDTQNTPVHIKLWHREFWMMAFANLLLMMSAYMLIPALPPYLLQQGYSCLQVGCVMGAYGIGVFVLGEAGGGQHLGNGGAVLDGVDHVGGDKRDHHLADYLAKHQQRCGDRDLHVIADAAHKGFNHPVPPRLRGFSRASRRAVHARRG